jgi:hypothetical protein
MMIMGPVMAANSEAKYMASRDVVIALGWLAQ